MKTYQPCGHIATAFGCLCISVSVNAQITNVTDLVNAVNNGAANSTILVGPGTFKLTSQLKPKAGMTLKGAGVGQTIISGAPSWAPSTSSLPDPEITTTGLDSAAYLIGLTNAENNITISDMTMTGAQLHGAVYGNDVDGLHLYNISVDAFLYCGFRLFRMDGGRIHHCEFLNAGGRWSNGSPGVTGGISGGAIFVTYMGTSEISNNRFTKTKTGGQYGFYGIKGRQGRNSRIHHNTINVDFSVEFPFENDQNMEIDHNVCKGVISIPKDGGGPVPAGGYTFHIHHNYFTKPYAIELTRNGVKVDHNLFDFQTNSDYGNLFSCFGSAAAQGPVTFHDNLVKNPGRGVFWAQGVYNNLQFYNNHVKASTTVTPRTEGLFGFNSGGTFSTVTIRDNIIECSGQTRPLVRNSQSRGAVIENNTLVNVGDSGLYANPNTGAVRGPTAPLLFTCGMNDEYRVDGWSFSNSPPAPGMVVLTSNHSSYSNQDVSGSTVVNSPSSVTLTGNNWKKFPFSYTITPNTVLTFTVGAADAGEIIGIGLEDDNDMSNARRLFQVGGFLPLADGWPVNPKYLSGSGPKTYRIKVGGIYTGQIQWLVLAAGDDADASANVTFSDIGLSEALPNGAGTAITFTTAGLTPYDSVQDGANGRPTAVSVNPTGREVTLTGNSWKCASLPLSILPGTLLEFTVNAQNAGEILGISLDDNTAPTSGRRAFRFGGRDIDVASTEAWSWKLPNIYPAGSGDRTYLVPVGTYFTGTVNHVGFIADDDASGAAVVTFKNIRIYQDTDQSWALWQRENFGTAWQTDSMSGPQVVAAGDGLSNLVKYALGMPATVPGTIPAAFAFSDHTCDFTYSRPSDRPNLIYRVEASTDLTSASWSADGLSNTRVAVGEPETWRASHSSTGDKIFFRLKLIATP